MWFIFIGLHKDRIQDYLNSLQGMKVDMDEIGMYSRKQITQVYRVDHIKETDGDIHWFLISCETRDLRR